MKYLKSVLSIALSIVILFSAFSLTGTVCFTGTPAAAAENNSGSQLVPEKQLYTLSLGSSAYINVSGGSNFTYKSSAASIVTVTSDGMITGLALGSASVTITASSGASTSVIVTVVPVPATKIISSVAKKTLYDGETVNIVNTFIPENTTYKTATYTSSNSSIIFVNSKGQVFATGIGAATVTITTVDENPVSTTLNFVVLPQPNFSISVPAEMNVNETAEITVDTKYELEYKIDYEISDPSIITINEDGTITSLKEGNTALTATITLNDGFVITKVKEIKVDNPDTPARCYMCDMYDANRNSPLEPLYWVLHTFVHFFETLFM